ncbi:MAG: hypothetical protein KDJ55_14815 [Rhodobiaceae bacterium]|nr:hypothetical protein [Rhodobiaceae bacterium]MCC0050554.1 hypothetical protein [Rhodobiaceae bacterium]MCC0061293.1 hypothetical protein [Rhodobiaceae bacterium]
MLRIIAIQALFFLLPFLVYGFWLYFSRQVVNAPENWKPHLFWLVVAGFVVTIAAFIAMAAFSGAPTTGVYTPPEIRDGVVVPGTIE